MTPPGAPIVPPSGSPTPLEALGYAFLAASARKLGTVDCTLRDPDVIGAPRRAKKSAKDSFDQLIHHHRPAISLSANNHEPFSFITTHDELV